MLFYLYNYNFNKKKEHFLKLIVKNKMNFKPCLITIEFIGS